MSSASDSDSDDDEDYDAYGVEEEVESKRYPIHDACEFDDLDALKVRDGRRAVQKQQRDEKRREAVDCFSVPGNVAYF